MKMFHSLPQWAQIGFIIGAIFGLLFLVLGIIQLMAGFNMMSIVFSFVMAIIWFVIAWFVAMKGNPDMMKHHTIDPTQDPTLINH